MSRRPIDFAALQSAITPERVLYLLRWTIHPPGYGEPHGPCVDERCSSRSSRVLSWNSSVAYCHRCGRTWDAVGIYATARGLGNYAAAVELCLRLGMDVPYLDQGCCRL